MEEKKMKKKKPQLLRFLAEGFISLYALGIIVTSLLSLSLPKSSIFLHVLLLFHSLSLLLIATRAFPYVLPHYNPQPLL